MNKKQLLILSKELCNIFDKYEMNNLELSNDSNESWRNYKFVRNTIRDFFDNKIKEINK